MAIGTPQRGERFEDRIGQLGLDCVDQHVRREEKIKSGLFYTPESKGKGREDAFATSEPSYVVSFRAPVTDLPAFTAHLTFSVGS